jgi:D-alanyl-lipoteichoic acid acyltransferase DltB (MBOAT superfamily)
MEILKGLFLYDGSRPMIFTDSIFWFFFAFVILIYQGVHRRILFRNVFLLIFSLFFYYKTGGFFFVLIIFSTIVDYILGGEIHRSEKQSWRTTLLVFSLVINLGLLSYFKYTYFFTDLFNQALQTEFKPIDYLSLWTNQLFQTNLDISKIILPVGISFYTFQTLSYTLDIYRRQLKPVDNIIDFAFYVSFFPQLVAGPIVRASEFVPQIYEPYRLEPKEYGAAIFMILNGLTKKILISDYISSNFVDRVFLNPTAYSGFENLMAVYGYAIQIYCDFSGYTDIAIGLALLMGFRLTINFNSPYVSTSITDFWRRWHISLSSWLRDYLYISLGGNRSISLFTYMSVPITFIIFLVADGWLWTNFAFFLIVISIWILSRIYSEQGWLSYIGLTILVFFGVILFTQSDWYSMLLVILIISFWALLLARPELDTTVSTYLNLSITMLLGGLWHGASMRFIIWGALHGVALAIHKFWLDATGTKAVEHKGFRRFLGQFITFQFVCYCWIYFRANSLDTVFKMTSQIAYSFQWAVIPQVLVGYKEVFLLMIIAYIIHWIPRKYKDNLSLQFVALPDLAKAAVIALIVFVLFQARSAEIQPFIYFQF